MKKHIYYFLIVLAAWGTAFTAQGSDGNVSVSAGFYFATCNIMHDDSKNMAVPLGDIQRSELKTQGATSQKVPFTLRFTVCSGATVLKVSFMGTAAASDNTVFAPDNPGQSATVQNVGLQIMTSSNVVKKPNDTLDDYIITISGGDFRLAYSAAYKALNNTVKPGDANVTVEYNVTYL